MNQFQALIPEGSGRPYSRVDETKLSALWAYYQPPTPTLLQSYLDNPSAITTDHFTRILFESTAADLAMLRSRLPEDDPLLEAFTSFYALPALPYSILR